LQVHQTNPIQYSAEIELGVWDKNSSIDQAVHQSNNQGGYLVQLFIGLTHLDHDCSRTIFLYRLAGLSGD
jgi:hypothetical protein